MSYQRCTFINTQAIPVNLGQGRDWTATSVGRHHALVRDLIVVAPSSLTNHGSIAFQQVVVCHFAGGSSGIYIHK